MARYRRKPVEVDAVRWTSGTEVDGVEEKDAAIHFSESGRYFYAVAGDFRPDAWLPVNQGDDEKIMPFAFWAVKSGRMEPIADGADDLAALFDRYMDYAGHPEFRPMGLCVIGPPDMQETAIVRDGDWIIIETGGRRLVASPAQLDELYEAIE